MLYVFEVPFRPSNTQININYYASLEQTEKKYLGLRYLKISSKYDCGQRNFPVHHQKRLPMAQFRSYDG